MNVATLQIAIRKAGLVSCLAAATFAAISFSAARSQACTRDPPPVGLVGYPSHGATWVPTDVVPIYEAYAGNVLAPEMLANASFVLRTTSGTVVPTIAAPSTYPWYVELTLAGRLAPYAAHVLEATLPSRYSADPVRHTITFWTGEGPAAPPQAPSNMLIQNYAYAYDGPINTCDPPSRGTCLAVPNGSFIVVQNESSSFGPSLLRGPSMNYSMNLSSATPSGCLTLRTRGLNGVLSEPVLKCAETTPLFQLSSLENVECTTAGLVETKPVSGNPVPGCSVRAGSVPGSRGWLAGALALLGLLWMKHARRTAAKVC
jgi:MYXO-CTERM domain-containing protein